MLHGITNRHGRRYLWAAVLVSGGLIGLGTTASSAHAQNYRTYPNRPATPTVTPNNLSTSAAQINANLQSIYNQQRMPGWDWWRTYPYSPYNIYNPVNPYSPYNNYWNNNYNPVPIYPYGPYGPGPFNPVYPYIGSTGGLGATR